MNSSSPKPGEREYQAGHAIAPESPDAKWLAEMAAGHTEVFWCVWDRYKQSLHRLCLREWGGHAADAEDALSQVMLKAQARLPACAKRIRCLEAWLHRLARNLCIDLRRNRNRKTEAVERWNLTTEAEPQTCEPIVSAEAETELRRFINTLPERLRESFLLHSVEEIPVKEVAAKLGVTPANVRKRVQLARASLRLAVEGTQSDGHDPIIAAAPSRRIAGSWEVSFSTAHILSVRVKLACGVDQLFHVFPAKAPFSLERKIKLLQRDLLQHPDHWKKHRELADLFYLTGDWDGAVVQWRRPLSTSPDLPGLLKLGGTLLKLGKFAAATEIFKSARRRSFQSAATGQHLDGWIALGQKNAARAVMGFQAAANLEPKNSAHWLGLASAEWLAGGLTEARAAIQRALDLNPNDLMALSLGHDMLLAGGDIEEAIRRAQHLLKLAPLDLLTLRRLVDLRCQLRLTQGPAGVETTRLLRSTQRVSKNPFLIHDTLAAFFFAQGKPERALAVHREFVEAHPQCLHSREVYSLLLAATDPVEPSSLDLDVAKLALNQPCHGNAQCGFLGA